MSAAVSVGGWKIVFSSHWKDFFEINKKDLERVLEDLGKLSSSVSRLSVFRYDFAFASIEFSSLVDTEKKNLRVFSRELNQELALIKVYTLDEKLKQIQELKADVDLYLSIRTQESPTEIERLSAIYGLSPLWEKNFNEVHEETNRIMAKLIGKVSEYKASAFEKISDQGLDLTARYDLFRIHVLKFLAILPSLDHDRSGKEVKKSFIEALTGLIEDNKRAKVAIPFYYILLFKIFLFIGKIAPPLILSFCVRKAVELMAKRFIAGSSIEKAKDALEGLAKTNREATLDQLGELVVSKEEADLYLERVLEIINGLSSHIPKGARNGAGILKAHVSIKVSALCHDFKPYAFDYTYSLVAPRLIKILTCAQEEEVFINIDAEHYHFRDIVLKIYSKALLETPKLHTYRDTGIVVQAYLKDAYTHLRDVIELAKKRDFVMPIRLVKGAYWDAETVEARAHNFSSFQFLNKEETDIHYRQILVEILKEEKLQLTVASHNIQDHSFAEAMRNLYYPGAPVIEHQCLHMTYEALSQGLAAMKWAVRNYIPIGNLLVGMAYLVRRIMENSSQVGILTIMRSHKKALIHKSPYDVHFENLKNNLIVREGGIAKTTSEFKNIFPFKPYSEEHLASFYKAQDDYQRNLPYQFGGDYKIHSNQDANLILGNIEYDDENKVASKIDELYSGFVTTEWKNDISLRVNVLLKLADMMLIKRNLLSVHIMNESGKTLNESYADVDEAIDFINFYAREAIELSSRFDAKGVMGVIAPWNFPLAILCGMTVASLSTGNAVIFKPAEQTPLVGELFYQLLLEAGVPANIVKIAQGDHIVGSAIVAHNLIAGVIFTGSKKVGVEIYNKLALTKLDPLYVYESVAKTVITEMGGKNAIIIANNCEMDETVSGILYSSFGHAGQKCSAASRVIVHEEIKDVFIERFKKACIDLRVGQAIELETYLNPIVSLEEARRIRENVKHAATEAESFGGAVHLDRSHEFGDTNIVGPVIIEIPKDIAMKKDSWAQREIFGPVVHVISYHNYDEALEIFNSTEYALTGGVFSQSQNDIDYLTQGMIVGNIYVNRPNTGARVAIEPFGGFKLSGTGPKAGGRDYLKQFVKEKPNAKASLSSFNYRNEANYTKLDFDFYDAADSDILKKAIEAVSTRLEELAQSSEELVKAGLSEFKKEFSDLRKVIREKVSNRIIPGQLSYTQYDRPLGNGLFIIGHKGVELKTLENIFISLLQRNTVRLLSFNERSDVFYHNFVNLLYEVGFSKGQIEMKSFSLNVLKEVSLKDVDFIYIDDKDFDTNLLPTLPIEKVIRILYPKNNLTYFERAVEFSHARSFAINIMRHGAPMELE